jgi:hypothetical protein
LCWFSSPARTNVIAVAEINAASENMNAFMVLSWIRIVE